MHNQCICVAWHLPYLSVKYSVTDNSEYEVFNNYPVNVDCQSVAALNQKIHKIQEESKLLREKVAFLEQAKLTVILKNVIDRIEHIEKEMKCCMEYLQNGDKTKDVVKGTLTDEEQNRELLRSATSDQVCSVWFSTATCFEKEILRTVMFCFFFQILQALDSMGLHQYKDAFSQESVDGAVLLELDEEVLTCELGVKSKIHRVKHMKLISGESSIQKFLFHTNT